MKRSNLQWFAAGFTFLILAIALLVVYFLGPVKLFGSLWDQPPSVTQSPEELDAADAVNAYNAQHGMTIYGETLTPEGMPAPVEIVVTEAPVNQAPAPVEAAPASSGSNCRVVTYSVCNSNGPGGAMACAYKLEGDPITLYPGQQEEGSQVCTGGE